MKATKELEEHGFIETKVMGVPSKKFFHITNQIEKTFLSEGNPRYAQKEKLDLSKNKNIPSYSQREHLSVPMEHSLLFPKGSSIKENKEKEINKKEITKTTTSSCLDNISEGFIDKELKSKYPSLPFDVIKSEVLKDESLVIKTEAQYEAMLKYRLENWSPKKQKNQRKEIVPDWLEGSQWKQEEEEFSAEELEQMREKLLIELGITKDKPDASL